MQFRLMRVQHHGLPATLPGQPPQGPVEETPQDLVGLVRAPHLPEVLPHHLWTVHHRACDVPDGAAKVGMMVPPFAFGAGPKLLSEKATKNIVLQAGPRTGIPGCNGAQVSILLGQGDEAFQGVLLIDRIPPSGTSPHYVALFANRLEGPPLRADTEGASALYRRCAFVCRFLGRVAFFWPFLGFGAARLAWRMTSSLVGS